MRTFRNSIRFLVSRAKAVSLVFLVACHASTDPEPLLFGRDACSHCRMVLSDRRFGAEIVTTHGKVYKFDTLECMHAFAGKEQEKIGPNARQYLIDSARGQLIPAESALIAENPALRSPMGRAYMVAASREGLQGLFPAAPRLLIKTWAELERTLDIPAQSRSMDPEAVP